MVLSGYITYEDFDAKAEKYKIRERNIFTKGYIKVLSIAIILISSISFLVWREEMELKIYGRATHAIVYELKSSKALYEYYVEGKKYTGSIRINRNINFEDPTYQVEDNIPVKVGDKLEIKYSTKDPNNEMTISKEPIK